MSVTLKDVAALAGVSPSTVSRICNNNPAISRETKNKVLQAMAQLGYEPGPSSGTAPQNPKAIGIILPPSIRETYENAFFLTVIRGISQFCSEHQYLNTAITGKDEEELLTIIRTMLKNDMVSGFILMYSKQDDPVIDYLYNEGIPYALIGKACQYANQTIYIDNDNLLAGLEATEYLISLGHKKIAYIGSGQNMIFSADRKNGYLLALANHGIAFRPDYCIELPYLPEDEDNPIHGLLEMKDRPTAIVVSDDIFALALERLCIKAGLSIPEDVSIISFNNSLFARLTSPQLTSVDTNAIQLGIESASQLISHLENPNLMATKIIVPHHLLERDSCRRI